MCTPNAKGKVYGSKILNGFQFQHGFGENKQMCRLCNKKVVGRFRILNDAWVG